MKKFFKRSLAIVLTMLMLLSVAPVGAFAAEDEGYNVEKQMETSLEATSSVGQLISEELDEAQTEDESNGFFISNVVMNKATATVSLVAAEDCRVIVAAYDEESGKMLTKGMADVAANAESVTVSLTAAELPQYYKLKAFLIGENDEALCESYATEHYTSAFKEIMETDIFDFEPEQVLNLDDSYDTNFMVFSEDTVTVTGDTATNVLVSADIDNNTYVFENIDNQIKDLVPGDKFYFDNGNEDEINVIIVKSISVSGSTATIIAEDASLEDLFEFIKIDTAQQGADFEINEDDPADDFEFVQDIEIEDEAEQGELTTQGNVNITKSKSVKKEFEIKKKEKKDKNDDKKFEYKVNKGTLTFQLDVNFKFYLTDDYKEVEFVVNPSVNFEMSIEGTLKLLKFEMKEAKFKLCTGVKLVIKPTFVLTASGTLSLKFEIKGALGVGWDSNNGASNKSKPFKFKPSIELEAELFIGIDLNPELQLVSKKLCKVKLTGDKSKGQIGFKVTAKTYLFDPDKLDGDATHDCKKCISGDISFILKFGLKLIIAEDTKLELSDSWDIVNVTAKISDWHYSITHNDFGLCKCPYDHTSVTFGRYPQTQETGSSKIKELNNLSKSWKSYEYYTGTGDWSDGNMAPSNYMKYADIDTDNDGKYDYRAVKFTQYRPYWTGDESTASNSYQSDNGYYENTVYYFKYEPLKWRVLDSSTGLIMCDNIIDSQAYQNFIYYNGGQYYNSKDCENYAYDWETSSLRTWLNEDFYNTAFTANQQSKILTTHNENKTIYNGTDTDDKIFVISYDDSIKSKYGFSSDSITRDTARQFKGTDYARCQGLYVYINESKDYNGTSWWWLRSTDCSDFAAEVGYAGWVFKDRTNIYGTDVGVVPALRLSNLGSVISTASFDSDTISADEESAAQKTDITLTLGTGEAIFDGISGNQYMLYSVKNYSDDFTLSIENLEYVNQAMAVDGKVNIGFFPTDSTTTVIVGDFGNGIEAKKATFISANEKVPQVSAVSLGNMTMDYKSSKTLAPEITADDGADYTITYTSDSKNVTVDENGKIYGAKRGTSNITVTVTDSQGNTVTDTCKVEVKYTWWQWLIKIVLFGWIWY